MTTLPNFKGYSNPYPTDQNATFSPPKPMNVNSGYNNSSQADQNATFSPPKPMNTNQTQQGQNSNNNQNK